MNRETQVRRWTLSEVHDLWRVCEGKTMRDAYPTVEVAELAPIVRYIEATANNIDDGWAGAAQIKLRRLLAQLGG